jgi:aspartate/methionine/tyrosine aminotransferase
VILIDSPSKRLFTNNLKIGLVFADVEIVERLRDFSDWHLGNLTGLQMAFARSLFRPENRESIETICTTNANRACANFQLLETVVEGSTMVSLIRPNGGFHALLFARGSISRNVDAMDACLRLVTDLETLAIPTNDFFFDCDDEFGIRLNLMSSPRKWEHVIKHIAARGMPV